MRMTGIPFIGFFMTPLRVAIFARASRTFTVWRRFQPRSSIIAWLWGPLRAEYGGLLDNRSFGGAQVSRTFYARGQTGQQLLLGAYSTMMRQVSRGQVELFPRREMLDLVQINGVARGSPPAI